MKNHWLKDKLDAILSEHELKLLLRGQVFVSFHFSNHSMTTPLPRFSTFEEYFKSAMDRVTNLSTHPFHHMTFYKSEFSIDYHTIIHLEKINYKWVRRDPYGVVSPLGVI